MAVRFGEIDASQIVENEYRIGVLEGIIDWILANNNAFVDDLTPEVMDDIRQRVGKRLQDKYPKTGIAVS